MSRPPLLTEEGNIAEVLKSLTLFMTFNLMLASKDAVYLSGDFRLTSLIDHSALPDSYDTQKVVPVTRYGWAALVGYMGVASAPPVIHDVGEWIVEQLETIPVDGKVLQLPLKLLEANSWLGKIRGDTRLAFSVVGFCEGQPFMMLISNFLDFEGQATPVGPKLKLYRRTINEPEVRAIGSVRVDFADRVRLKRLLATNPAREWTRNRIRQIIAEANVNAAKRSKGSVSEECISGYLLRSGSAEIGVFKR